MSTGAATAPLYSLLPTESTSAPQCSQSTDFCFFCEYSDATADDGTNIVGDLKQLGRALAEEKKETATIVTALVEAYDDSARSQVVWTAPNGKEIIAPEWSRTSAMRHIMFSPEFQAFDNAVDQMFHTMIYKLNNTAVERESGNLIEETRHALIETIGSYSKWKTSQHKLSNAGGSVPSSRSREVSHCG